MRRLFLLLPAVLGLLSCQASDGFECTSDAACSNDGIAGECQSTGYCSFPDPDCASGQRYGELAELFAQQCVPPTTDTEAGGQCGDGVLDPGEACDGSDIGSESCTSQGFASGALSCTDTCELDTTSCSPCGNGAVDPGEQCDGTNLGAVASCADVGLGEARELLACTAACQLDYGACSSCGDGEVTAPEECDGETTNVSCREAGLEGGGNVGCGPGCTLDTSACGSCGNGVAEDGEACDGADLNQTACEDLDGFSGGALGCGDNCTFDPQNCSVCGDGATQQGETCDGLDLGDTSCESLGFQGGDLSCGPDCDYDVSDCDGAGCGNKVIDAGEACDGGVGDEDCASIGSGVGQLSCENCAFDISGCSPAATVSVSGTGVATDAATITLACESGIDSCTVGGLWEVVSAGCSVVCGEGEDVTVSASFIEGSFTVPGSIDYGAPVGLVCSGANPCELTTAAENGLDITVDFVAIG